MVIRALNRRIEILSFQESRDTYGGVTGQWVTVGQAWAGVLPKSGTEYFSNEQVKTKSIVIINLRYHPEITHKHRIKYLDKYYDILSVMDEDSRHEKTVLQCREVADGLSG